MKVNVAVSLNIREYSGSGITDYVSGNTNCISYEDDGSVITTQRSSIDISEDGVAIGADSQGRGIFYWEENSKDYIVNNDSVYATSQNTSSLQTISTGIEPVTILETIGTPYLVFLDAENDEGWYMNAAESFTQFTTNFPTTLAHGGAELDGYLFFMDEEGVIYNTDVNDISISATSYITAERENDKGVYLGKHHEHLAAFLSRSIEFFYNASNTSGSPINRRPDITHSVGCSSGLSVWENGDTTYFIGSKTSSQMAVYELKNFQMSKISDEELSAFLTQAITQDGLNVRLSGLQMMGNDILIINIMSVTGSSPGSYVPNVSISFNAQTGQWGFIETALNSHDSFPLMATTRRTGGQNNSVTARTGVGIFYNGDIININDKMIPIDTVGGNDGVYEDGVYEDDIYTSGSDATGTNISTVIRTGLIDGNSSGYKTNKAININMKDTDNDQTMTIKRSKEKSDNFDTGKTINTAKARKQKRINGRFIRENIQLEYSGDEQFFIKNIDLELEAGT